MYGASLVSRGQALGRDAPCIIIDRLEALASVDTALMHGSSAGPGGRRRLPRCTVHRRGRADGGGSSDAPYIGGTGWTGAGS